MTLYKIILWGFFFLLVPDAISQSKYCLKVIDNSTNNEIDLKYSKSFNVALEREKEIIRISNAFSDKGYLSFSIDKILNDSSCRTIFINKGLAYQWVKIKTGQIDENILKKAGYDKNLFDNKIVKIEDLRNLKQRIIKSCENNGYPFAETKLDSIIINDNLIEASLILNKNNLILFDSIVIKGNADIKPSFLYNFTGIKQGNIYNESLINKIDKKINDLSFLSLKKPTSIVFFEDRCNLLIYSDKKNASNFDGILGIVPNNITGNIVLTGDVKLKLYNSFKAAEMIELNWKRLMENTQKLYLDFNYPYIFSTPFGIEYNIDLLQKDTSYISVKQNGSLKYMFDGFDYVNFFGDFYNSNLLNTANFESLTVLPDFADISSILFGMGLHKEDYDFRLNPSKGYLLQMSISTGNKTIEKNSKLNQSLYDGISLKSKQYKYDLLADIYINPFKRNVLLLGVNAGKMFSQNLFQNELYRLGGAKLLRGFDEESILASFYSLFTVEYRYLVDRMSFINAFIDGAYYENKSINKHIIDRPYGFGAGFTFETKQGIFSISYALGKQFNNPVQFKSGKIHLGYINYF